MRLRFVVFIARPPPRSQGCFSWFQRRTQGSRPSVGLAPLLSEAGLPSLVQALPSQGMRRQFKSGPGLQTLLLGGFGPLFGPACQDCFSGAFASLFGR